MTSVYSNADTIMDLATPPRDRYPPSSPKGSYMMNEESNIDKNTFVYTMEEPDQAEVDRIVSDHIVSAVKKGLRKSKRSSSSKTAPKSSKAVAPTMPATTPANATPKNGSNSNVQSSNRQSSQSHAFNPRSTKKSNRPPQSKDGSNHSRSSKKTSKSSRGIEVVPVVSDEEDSADSSRHKSRHSTERSEWSETQQSSKSSSSTTAGFPGFLHRMMYNEEQTVNESMQSDSVDCEYNYIDDESYGNTTRDEDLSTAFSNESSDGMTSGSSSMGRVRGRRDRRHDENDDDSTTASLSEDAFELGLRDSHDDTRETNSTESGDGGDKDKEAFQYVSPASAPRGLDIVARLLAGATELSLDSSSITVPTMEDNNGGSGGSSSTKSKKTPVHEIARHVSDALSQTKTLQRVAFCGPWNARSFKERLVLEILFDGLLDNTSIHTVVIRDNPKFDSYTGYAFGTMLKSHQRISKLELVHCRFVESGWNSLFLGMQHSKSINALWVEDIPNLSGDHVDAISSTMRYLQMKRLRLCDVQLHKISTDSLSTLLRSIQQTKTIEEVDLSKNDLGSAPRAILLLSKCLSGDPVWIGNSDYGERNHLPIDYRHHIEKLILVDCGIYQKSSVRTLARALDSTQAKLDASNNEHPLVLHTLDFSKNKFGNGGARILQKLVDTNPKITTFGMVGCNAGASNLKTMADRLRYNNSFLQKIGLSSDVSLAILDSVSAVDHVFGCGGNASKTAGGPGVVGMTMVEDDESDIPAEACCP